MAQVLVRNLDETVVESLKTIASQHHRSLEAEVRAILEQTARQARMDEFRRRAADIRARFGDRVFSDSTELIREDRER
jgi:plasmid stability protein